MATSRTYSVPSTPTTKTSRLGQFTPKRTPSTDLSQSSLNARLSRVNQPVLLNVTTKKYKAPLSAEARKLSNKPKIVLSPVLGSPTKRDGVTSRPRTPVSPSLKPATSEMDVSNVDPELVLVDSQTVEPGDVSGEIDGSALDFVHGKEDKVMVSIRIRPTDSTNAWIVSPSNDTLKLDPAFARHANSSSNSTSYTFDSVLTGTANKPVYSTVARSHVHAAMEGYNAVIFAYGQTASGKTFTLSGTDDEPGIIPRAMREVFGYIKRTPDREYLLRCSYLEIYNETLFDLLAPPVVAKANPVQIQGGMGGTDIVLSPLREEVVTSLKGVKEVLKRGEGNRRTACTDWNERSSRSHSVFRLVIESRERGRGRMEDDDDDDDVPSTMTSGRHTPGRQTPGLNGRQTPGPRLQARGGRSVQSSVLSLIDLAGSEKATSSKDRTREGKYINTSLLTLGTVIGTLAENAAKHKADHVPYRNSKLTRMLQPSLSGNARISVICTISPDAVALAETLSTLGFAKRVKSVQLHAKKTEVVDTDALIERYRKEIEELKARLAEREAEAPVRNRRLSAREQNDESKAMKDLNSRIEQLTKLILTSASVDDTVRDHDGEGGESQPESPIKVDFDMSPYQLQQELLAARLQIETQAHQILSLEASLLARSHATGELGPADASPEEKDRLIAEQARMIRELESYEEKKSTGVGEEMEVELRRVRDEIETEWEAKFEEERKVREEKERWAEEVVKALEKEKKTRVKLEEERRALAAFVSKFDSLGLRPSSAENMSKPKAKLAKPLGIPSPGNAMSSYERRQSRRSFSGLSAYSRLPRISDVTVKAELESEWDPNMDGISLSQDDTGSTFILAESDSEAEAKDTSSSSPFRLDHHQHNIRMQMQADALNAPRLLDQAIPEEVENCMLNLSFDEVEVEEQLLRVGDGDMSVCFFEEGAGGLMGLGISMNNGGKVPPSEKREVLGNKENLVK